MATIPGYNPSVSLLPNGGGTIQAMSGGGAPPGFNPSISYRDRSMEANISVDIVRGISNNNLKPQVGY